MIKQLKVLAIGAAALLASITASATVLLATTSADIQYSLFISVNDSQQGSIFATGVRWPMTFVDIATLAPGTDYFLHVYVHDEAPIAGFLGDFTLFGPDHKFTNGLTTLSSDTAHWLGNNTGWGGVYNPLSSAGANGVWPWGTRPSISAAAEWIWAGNAALVDNAWFSTKISAVKSKVPEASSFLLMVVGLLGLVFARRKQM